MVKKKGKLIKPGNGGGKKQQKEGVKVVNDGYMLTRDAYPLEEGFYRVHYGFDREKGYYTCFFKKENRCWYMYSDHLSIKCGERVTKPQHVLPGRIIGRIEKDPRFIPSPYGAAKHPLKKLKSVVPVHTNVKKQKRKKVKVISDDFVLTRDAYALPLEKGFYQVHYGIDPDTDYYRCYYDGKFSWYMYGDHKLIHKGERVRKPTHVKPEKLTGPSFTRQLINCPPKNTSVKNPLKKTIFD
ncbi:MAG: hypothetical protein ACPGO5_04870 [Patescibacteria group bacterium]